MCQTTGVIGVLIVLALWGLAAVLATLGVFTLPSPPMWFDAWSKLIAAVVAAVIGARVLWSAPQLLQAFLDRMK